MKYFFNNIPDGNQIRIKHYYLKKLYDSSKFYIIFIFKFIMIRKQNYL